MSPQVRITDSLAYRIHRCARLLRKHFLTLGARDGFDLTPEQWFVLNKLAWDDGLSQVELGDAIFADRPNMTRIVQSLENKSLVRREGDPEDQRRQRVYLTTRGRKEHDRFAANVPATRELVFRGLNEDEIRTVERALALIEQNLTESM